ncbi:MAG: DUF4397 domain-containing protein [Actinomycetota bacterium]|nr:DUF4397 domain-containing protein [Actinomycetota bacterium]
MRTLVTHIVTVGAVAAAALAVLPAGPAVADRTATVTVLHALPASGVVDVYSGRSLVIDDLAPGRTGTIALPGGTARLSLYADDTSPTTAAPLLALPSTRVAAGSNVTVAAHLSERGIPTASVFVNDTRTVGMGMGRLTVRHLAAAPPIDLRADGRVLMADVANPRQSSTGMRAGTYRVDLVRAGTRTLLAGPDAITIRNRPGRDDMGTNTIVYAWGTAQDLRVAVQEVRIDLQ